MNKVIVILGPTASGKTGLGVKLAYKFKGEIISSDSRQVYKGMDIGTGKDLDEYSFEVKTKGKKKKVKIKHHLLDIVKPMTEFNLVKFLNASKKAIKEIVNRENHPFVVGGTGYYVEALVEGYQLADNKSDMKLREGLEKKSIKNLYNQLLKLKPAFAKKLNESEKNNKRRLARYIEIAKTEPEMLTGKIRKKDKENEYLLLGITRTRDEIKDRIYKRLIERLEKEDMVGEVERLHKEGVTWKRMEGFGLEYKYISLYLRGKLTYDEMVEKLNIAIRQFAKRQMTWFRRWERQGAKIHWVKNQTDAGKLVKEFLK